MGRYTKQDVIDLVRENDVEFIRLQFSDLFGTMKNVAITARQLEKALDNKCTFDGSSVDGFVRIEESDMYLYPDLDSFAIFPWNAGGNRVARLICDVYGQDGLPFAGDPRNVLKRVMVECQKMGYKFNVGPECEFFLFHTDEEGRPTTKTHEMAGYFDVAPIDLAENVRRDIVLNLEEMGFEIESSHHEIAPAQHEVDFQYEKGLKAADNILTFKMAVKSIAKQHGLHATFMPKPKAGVNGSGMHINMSLEDKLGKNLFADTDDKLGLSRLAYEFMAGILAHIKSMCLLTNPIVNSYKRLIPGYDAPVYIAWSRATNRGQIVRIPSSRGASTRLELRSPDSAMNPYLALAACLAAGLDGIKNHMELPEPVVQNIYAMDEETIKERGIDHLPETLGEAIDEFEEDVFLRNVLGDHIFYKYLEAKKEEWNVFRSQVTDWEIGEYLYKY